MSGAISVSAGAQPLLLPALPVPPRRSRVGTAGVAVESPCRRITAGSLV